jgi:hypothetical protein
MLFIYDYFMHNRLYCNIPPIRVCVKWRVSLYRRISDYKLSDLNEVTDVIRSKELMSIQSAGNQRVYAYTLVGSSETVRQWPGIEECTYLNGFAIENFHISFAQKIFDFLQIPFPSSLFERGRKLTINGFYYR